MYRRQHPEAAPTAAVAASVEMNALEASEAEDERDVAVLLRT